MHLVWVIRTKKYLKTRSKLKDTQMASAYILHDCEYSHIFSLLLQRKSLKLTRLCGVLVGRFSSCSGEAQGREATRSPGRKAKQEPCGWWGFIILMVSCCARTDIYAGTLGNEMFLFVFIRGVIRGDDEEICGLGFREETQLCCAVCWHEAGHLPRSIPASDQWAGSINQRQTHQGMSSSVHKVSLNMWPTQQRKHCSQGVKICDIQPICVCCRLQPVSCCTAWWSTWWGKVLRWSKGQTLYLPCTGCTRDCFLSCCVWPVTWIR